MTSIIVKTTITIISLIAMITGYKVMQSNVAFRNARVFSPNELTDTEKSQIRGNFILRGLTPATMPVKVLQSKREKNIVRLVYDPKAGNIKFIIIEEKMPGFLTKLSVSDSSYFTHEALTQNAREVMHLKGFTTDPETMVLKMHKVPFGMFSSFLMTISGLFAGSVALISLIPAKTYPLSENNPNKLPTVKRRQEESVDH